MSTPAEFDERRYRAILAVLNELRPTERPRRCLYILETSFESGEGRGYIPVLVTEGEPGYTPMRGNGEHAQPWYWGHHLGTARLICAKANHKLGYTDADVQEIVISSMAAQFADEDVPAE